MSKVLKTEVLIIGGGPAGIISGIYLDLLGVSSIIVERQFEISTHPKAHELSARSIEILCQLGFTIEELKQEASSYRDASRVLFCHTINEELGEIDLQKNGNDEKYKAHLASPEPYLNLSQTELEKLLRKKLADCEKNQLLLGHQWETMEENEGGIESRIFERKTESEYIIKSKYVICADGAGSRSRKALGIPMIGEEKLQDFISVYFELNLRDYLQKPAKLFWMLHPEAPGTFIAHHIDKRWVYHFPIYTPYEKREDYTEEILKDRILKALGTDKIPLKIDSVGIWRMTSQIAQVFRKGKAFLVGDAAHRFPPTGGLGMNTGIGDVQNLCWKLAMVLKGIASEELLNTYETERRPVIQLNSQESLRNYYKIYDVLRAFDINPDGLLLKARILNSFLFKLIPKNWIEALLQKIYPRISRNILAVKSNPEKNKKVQESIADQIDHFDRIGLDLGYSYDEGAIVFENEKGPKQTVSEYTPSLVPGVRFPHFWMNKGSDKISSHELLEPTKFCLITSSKGLKWWKKHGSQLPTAIKNLINIHSLDTNTLYPIKKDFCKIDSTALLLIRPDGQIAWRQSTLQLENLQNLNPILQKIIPQPITNNQLTNNQSTNNR